MERGGRAHVVFLVAELTELAYELGVEVERMRGIEDGIQVSSLSSWWMAVRLPRMGKTKVEWRINAIEYTSLEFQGANWTKGRNVGAIRTQMVFKVMRMDELMEEKVKDEGKGPGPGPRPGNNNVQ